MTSFYRARLVGAVIITLLLGVVALDAEASDPPTDGPLAQELTPDPNAPGPPGSGSVPTEEPEAEDDTATATYVLAGVAAAVVVGLVVAVRRRLRRGRPGA